MAGVDKQTLERYVALDKQIHEQESRNIIKAYSVKEAQVTDLEQTVKQLQAHYDECVRNTEKEKSDVDQLPNVRQMFDQASYDAKMTKEQEEYMDAVNKQEIAKKELDGVLEQQAGVKKELEKLEGEKSILTNLYEEYDKLLSSIFKGDYGSAEENRLESQLDMHLDKKQRIQVASYKWTNGRQLLGHAVTQLTVADKKWQEVAKVPNTNGKKKYDIATETRNNVIAACQNLTNTQKYLANITFPYCTAPEVQTLNRAVQHIYTDMMTTERHAHASNVYTVTRKRAAALLQWFDNVISNTINKDMEKANAEANTCEIELRKERLRLIKDKISEESGVSNVQVKGEMDLGKEAKTEANTEYVSKPEPGAKASAPAAAAAAIPLNQLAPAPSQDEIFGEMQSLKHQHEQDMKEYDRAQDLNKTRAEQGLAEKLAARRNRRERMGDGSS